MTLVSTYVVNPQSIAAGNANHLTLTTSVEHSAKTH